MHEATDSLDCTSSVFSFWQNHDSPKNKQSQIMGQISKFAWIMPDALTWQFGAMTRWLDIATWCSTDASTKRKVIGEEMLKSIILIHPDM